MLCREKEPWEASDGAVYMLRELSGALVLLVECTSTVASFASPFTLFIAP